MNRTDSKKSNGVLSRQTMPFRHLAKAAEGKRVVLKTCPFRDRIPLNFPERICNQLSAKKVYTTDRVPASRSLRYSTLFHDHLHIQMPKPCPRAGWPEEVGPWLG